MDSPLFVSAFGTGRPVLCLHGIESHGIRFLGLAQRLTDFHVVAPDLRGHGRSPMDGPWTIDRQLADLQPLLDSLGPETIMLGHSYGGLLAWEMARAAPDQLTGLILVDPAIAVGADLARVSTEEYTGLGHSWADSGEAFRELSVGRPAGALWSVALDVAVAIGQGPGGRLHPLLARDAVHAAWAQMQHPLRPTTWRGPTLLLEAGLEKGAYASANVIREMREQLGESLDHAVLDTTHFIPSDYPDLLAEHVGRFLTRRRQDAIHS